MNKSLKFERDSAYRKRGGAAQWLLLICGVCKDDLSLYQKDGPGQLLRLYLDRITASDGTRPFRHVKVDTLKALTCLACDSLIATPMTYQKDDRPRVALRLINSGVDKIRLNNHDLDLISIDPREKMKSMLLNTGFNNTSESS